MSFNGHLLRVKRLTLTAQLPVRGSAGAIGYDLFADIGAAFPIPRMERRAIPTGIALAIPPGHYGRIAPRSGMALRDGIAVLGGVIDPDFTGEVKVILANLGDECVAIAPGQRIAQLILERASVVDVLEADELDGTGRGAGGFGSTGR